MGLLKKDKDNGYISAKESHRIAKENRKITGEIEKKRYSGRGIYYQDEESG